MNRRELLEWSRVPITLAVTAGCLSRVDDCRQGRNAVVELREANGTPNPDRVIRFVDLRRDEKEVVRKALATGEYRQCGVVEHGVPDAVAGLADRTAAIAFDDATGGPVYLERNSSYYRVSIVVLDEQYG